MIASPCIGVCRYDADTGWCIGCGRNKSEIATWGMAAQADRHEVWNQLPERMRRLGIGMARPPWTEPDVARQALTRARLPGLWQVGIPGASVHAELHDPDARLSHGNLVAERPGVRLRVRIDPQARVLAPVGTGISEPVPGDHRVDAGSDRRLPSALVWTVHRSLLPPSGPETVTELGEDDDPIDSNEGGWLFDLGVASPAVRVAVRVRDAQALSDVRSSLVGRSLQESEAGIRALRDRRGVAFVVENTHVRVEVNPGDGASDAERGGALVEPLDGSAPPAPGPGFDVPEICVPVATWQPRA